MEVPPTLEVDVEATIKKEPGYYDLIPFEIRQMVIDRMDFATKCKFSTISTISFDEVQQRKSSIQSVKISETGPNQFLFKLREAGRGTSEVIKSGNPTILFNHFDSFAENFHESLTTLVIHVSNFEFNKSNILRFENLEELRIIDIKRKIDVIKSGFTNLDQISKIVNNLVLPVLKLDEILQMQATRITISYVDCTRTDFIQFLLSLVNNQLHPNVYSIKFRFEKTRVATEGFETVFVAPWAYFAQRRVGAHIQYMMKNRRNPVKHFHIDYKKPLISITSVYAAEYDPSEWNAREFMPYL